MQARVYIETTIPSFYYEIRQEPEMVSRHLWTRYWWDREREKYELVTSEAVLAELSRGDYLSKSQTLALVESLPLLEIDESIVEIIKVYIDQQVMPKDPTGDALHLALASYHRCDYLLTWNCANLANANKFPHIRKINGFLGLFTPDLVTPLELLGKEVSL
jgi:predicted nucleic acid-binding protein